MNKTKKRPIHISKYDIAAEHQQAGEQVFYLKGCLFPTLEVSVIMREKSREQLGDIEKTLLELLQAGLVQGNSIAAVMGIAQHRLKPFIDELEGRSLIRQTQPDQYQLTELGEMSVAFGVAVVEVKKSILLCGLTGRLLPGPAYDMNRQEVKDLNHKVWSRELLDPKIKIPLDHLDISKLDDRHRHNIPDEAIAIVDILDHQPHFLEGVLSLVKTAQGIKQINVFLHNSKIDYLDTAQVMPLLEPFGYNPRKQQSQQQALQLLQQTLQDSGFIINQPGNIDDMGNPNFEISGLSTVAKNKMKISGVPITAYFGSVQLDALPISAFPLNDARKDLLNGCSMLLYCNEPILAKEGEILRIAAAKIDEYYQTARKDRPTHCSQFLDDHFRLQCIAIENVKTIAKDTGYKRLLSQL